MVFSAAAVAAATLALIAASAAPAQATNRWPRKFERQFMISCTQNSGGLASMCRCAMRHLERRYTARQITRIYIYAPVRWQRILIRVLRACG